MFRHLEKDQGFEVFRAKIISQIGIYNGVLVLFGLIARHFIHPMPAWGFINALIALVLLSLPVLLKKKVPTNICGAILVLGCSGVALISGLTNGGMRAPATVMLVLTPFLGFVTGGRWGGRLSLALSALTASFLVYAESRDFLMPATPDHLYGLNLALVYSVVAVSSYLIGVALDEARRAHENQIQALNAKSAHLSRLASLGELSAGIAHEINNPLAIISGNIQILEKHKGDPSTFKSKTDAISRAVSRIEKIINGLKKFSRTHEADGPHFKPESLLKIIEEATGLLSAKARNRGVEVQIEIPADLHLVCDALEIEQVLVNLIDNAIYAASQQPEKWIRIRAFQDQGEVIVQVTDSGPGLTAEIEQKLFHPFFTTKPVGEGTGLGLSISKGILDTHQATLSLNRSVQGTCFEVRFSGKNQAPGVA